MKKINYRRNSFLAVAAALALLVNQANAATFTWAGTTSGNWTTTTNWRGGVAPTAANTTDVIISGTANIGIMFIRDDRTIKSLTFDASNDGATQIQLGQTFTAVAATRSLTFSSNSGNATLTVEAGSTGDKTIQRTGAIFSNVNLTSSLDVIHNGSGTLTFAGQTIITGTGTGINKSGSGTLILNGANTYTGANTLSAGTLSVGVTANLGGGAANLVFDGGILQITGTTLANFSGIGHTVSFNATKTVGLDINNVAHTFTVDQVLNQTTGGFTKLGAGTVILNQTNTYTGATAVNGGTLRVNTPGLLDANSVVTVAGGATLGGDGTINGTVSVAANGSLTPGSAANTIGTLTLANGTASALSLNGSDLYFDLPDSGTTCDLIAVTGDLVLTGNSTVYLSAPNGAVPQGVYTQMTYAAKSGSGDINFPNGTKTMWNATLAVSSDSVTVTVASGGLQQDVWKGTASAVWDTSATNWTRNGVAGQAYVAGDAVIFDDSATTFSTISGTVSPSSVIFNNATAYAVSAAIGGAGPLVKDGSGTVTLSGSNTYTGTTTINEGTLKIQGGAFSTKTRNYSIASGAVLNLDGSSINKLPTGTSTISGTGTLRLTGGIVFGNTVSGGNFNLSLSPGALIDVQAGAFMQNGGWNAFNWAANSARLNVDGDFNMGDNWATVDALTGAGTITKGWDANTRVLTVGIADGSGTFSGTIANSSGTIALTKTGTGTQTLSGANTYTGDTKISGGKLTLGNSLALQSSTLDYNSYGGTLDFGALTNATFGGLKGTQNIALTNNFALSVGNNNANTTYSGALSGTGATLTKIGSGTLTLSATNTYTGTTSVSNGVLKLTLAEALASDTAVVISTTTDAKIDLAFDGTVTVKSLTVDGELLTRNKVYSSANLPIAFAPGDGLLYTLEGVPPKGTMVSFF